jgi:hypothetical protein
METVRRPLPSALAAEGGPVGGQAQLLGDRQAALQVGLGQDEHELPAAVAGEGVDVADAAGDPSGELDQHLVAPLVPEPVVDRLEVVDVQHEQGEDPAEAAGALDLLLEPALEVAVVPGPVSGSVTDSRSASAWSRTFSMATAAWTAKAVRRRRRPG